MKKSHCIKNSRFWLQAQQKSVMLKPPKTCWCRILAAAIMYSFMLSSHTIYAEVSTNISTYYDEIPLRLVDSSYAPHYVSTFIGSADLNNDGNQDLVILGADYPFEGTGNNVPQPSRVLLGDGAGGFVVAPNELFPVDSLRTVHPRKILFADFNMDDHLDMFVASHGWDTNPFPGEQNKLFLSNSSGGWQDATANLPQFSDFSHTAAVGDVDGDGKVDIFVGNGYGGQNQIFSYLLLNDGNGQFSVNRNNIPVDNGETLDFKSGHMFPGATLVDLDGDNLPELLITADASSNNHTLLQTTILWNNGGLFSESDKTILPLPQVFAESHIDLDIRSIEINGDGLPDLVVVGTQGQPFYDGWFVQLLINHGNKLFVDETVDRLTTIDMFNGTPGISTNTPWPIWINVLDFNHDGLQDFAIEFNPGVQGLGQTQPLIWLNNQNGHFATLKIGDLVAAGEEWRIGNFHLAPTQHGYSVFTQQYYPGSGGLIVTGLVASKPYQVIKTIILTPILMLLTK